MSALRLWSVTTLIKLGLGTSDALVNWAVKTTAEYAIDQRASWSALADTDRDGAIEILTRARYRSSSKAAARGAELHKAAEQLALGQSADVEADVQPYLDQYARFLERHQPEFLMAEAPVYNPQAGYAGTCDGVILLDGQPVLYDIKTTAHGPDSGRSRPPFAEVALQLAAYRHATEVGVLKEQRYEGGKRYYVYDPSAEHAAMPETDGAVCVVVSPEDFMVVPVRTDEQVWRHFRHVMECARWQVEVSRNVFGPAVTAPAQGGGGMTSPLRRDPCVVCGVVFTQPRKRGRPRILCDECASPEAVASRIADRLCGFCRQGVPA
jgi:hypothetical protein